MKESGGYSITTIEEETPTPKTYEYTFSLSGVSSADFNDVFENGRYVYDYKLGDGPHCLFGFNVLADSSTFNFPVLGNENNITQVILITMPALGNHFCEVFDLSSINRYTINLYLDGELVVTNLEMLYQSYNSLPTNTNLSKLKFVLTERTA